MQCTSVTLSGRVQNCKDGQCRTRQKRLIYDTMSERIVFGVYCILITIIMQRLMCHVSVMRMTNRRRDSVFSISS